MVKSRVAEDGRQIKRGNKKKKRKGLKIFLFVLLFFIIILSIKNAPNGAFFSRRAKLRFTSR